jgi:hypothetical protein
MFWCACPQAPNQLAFANTNMARTATRRVRVILAALTVAACAAAAGDHKQHHNPLERLNMAATVHAPDSAIKLVVNASALTQSRGQWVEVRLAVERARGVRPAHALPDGVHGRAPNTCHTCTATCKGRDVESVPSID